MSGRRLFQNEGGICVVLTVVFVIGAAVPASADDDPIVVCTQRLKTLHGALIAYERKHQQWPDHLSDLVPEFLADQAALRDPADSETGDLGSNQAHPDPKYRVSYSYERSSDVSNGLAQPLGPFPKPDISKASWGSWRLVNGRMEAFFGDQVPVVRCYHHRSTEEEREPGRVMVLNVTPSGRIYRSDYDWRRHPDSIDFLLRTLERDLSQGPAWVLRSWLLWRVDEFLGDDAGLSLERHGPRMSAVAEALLERHRELVGEERTSCRMAARLFRNSGRHDPALAALDAAARFTGAAWHPIVEKQLRAEIYHAARQWNEEIATYQVLLAERPGTRPFMENLASAYEAAGKPDLAREWRDKAEPGRLLVGKRAPAFQAALVDGSNLTIDAALRGRKAVLLDFWFCACGPCRLAFPHLEQLHRTLGSQGLAVIAVNFGDSKNDIAQFARDHKASFALGVGRQGKQDNPIFGTYHVSSFPTSFLIDAAGTIVWRGIGYGAELKSELSAALAKLGLEPKPAAPQVDSRQ